MSAFEFFFGRADSECCADLSDIFPLNLDQAEFVVSDILQTYTKILIDTIERTHGIPEAIEPMLWDSCVQTEATDGLVTLLADAMSTQSKLFLVYVKAVKVVRKATREEETVIARDYEEKGESSKGVFISFQDDERTNMLALYSAFEYCTLASLNKTLKVAGAVQVKVSELRSSVALADSAIAKTQGKEIASALKKGNDVMLDAKDVIETAKPDTAAGEKAIDFIDAKKAFILGFPLSYISGTQTTGIGSTGEADMRAVERGLKLYYVSIIRPVLKALFKINTEFKSQDFREITSGLELLKTLDLVSESLMSVEAKRELVARVFGLDAKKEEKLIEAGEADAEANPEEDDSAEEPKDPESEDA